MSGAIIRSKADYYRLLLDVTTTEHWEPWLLYVLRIVEAPDCVRVARQADGDWSADLRAGRA